jgi:hypothetical protein
MNRGAIVFRPEGFLLEAPLRIRDRLRRDGNALYVTTNGNDRWLYFRFFFFAAALSSSCFTRNFTMREIRS